MRIISGKSKGKKILEPKDLSTRPLKDLTKESIFNILSHSNKFNTKLENSNVLDLFSGTGSFGLECLSRGSANLTFVENYGVVLPILKENILNLNYQNNSTVIENNIVDKLNFKIFEKKFDIIFLDPPYKESDLTNLITLLIDQKILATNGVIIIHRHSKQNDIFPKTFQIIEKKKYGISKIIFGSYS